LQSFKVGILSSRCCPFRFFGLALNPTGFLFPLLYLFSFFSIAFCDGGFACSCDGSLLLPVSPYRESNRPAFVMSRMVGGPFGSCWFVYGGVQGAPGSVQNGRAFRLQNLRWQGP
jgi:hypothetical protein